MGILLPEPFGTSLSLGLFFAFEILGAQGLGWISGEWKVVNGKPTALMFIVIAILIIAFATIAYGKIL